MQVKASHLTPLSKADKEGQAPKTGLWNSVTCGRKPGMEINIKDVIRTEDKRTRTVPRTQVEFGKTWRQLEAAAEKVDWLRSLGQQELRRIFVTEIPTDVLDEIVVLFLEQEEETELAVETLLSIGQARRLTLSLQFQGKQERERMTSLVRRLGETGRVTDGVMVELRKAYCLQS